jgi:predicted DNA-binding transcriptional regulator AlpA
MSEHVKSEISVTPILFPYEPEQFWQHIREIIQEEISKIEKGVKKADSYETPGLTYKPLYKMDEVCGIFRITRPTVYEWIKVGKLKPYKIRSRVFFLWNDIEQLIPK